MKKTKITILALLAVVFLTSCDTIANFQYDVYQYVNCRKKTPYAVFVFTSTYAEDTVSFYINNDTIFENQILTSIHERNNTTGYGFVIKKKRGVATLYTSNKNVGYTEKILGDINRRVVNIKVILNGIVYSWGRVDLKKGRFIHFDKKSEVDCLQLYQRCTMLQLD